MTVLVVSKLNGQHYLNLLSIQVGQCGQQGCSSFQLVRTKPDEPQSCCFLLPVRKRNEQCCLSLLPVRMERCGRPGYFSFRLLRRRLGEQQNCSLPVVVKEWRA